MSDLSNKLINNTYKKLLQVDTATNVGVDTSLTNVQTGDGTNTAIKIATSAVQVTGTFGVSGNTSVVGDLQVTNKVCASAFFGSGANLTSITFTGDVSVSSLIVTNNVTIGGTVTIGGAVMVSGGEIQVKNGGAQSNIKLYCESGNAHYAALQAPPHSSFSGNITITLPVSTATLVGTSTTDTLTNKTFGDKVDFNSDVCISGDSVLVGNATIGGTLSVGGAVNILSTATVSGTAGFLGDVRVSGNTSVGGTLDVAGNVSLGGNVTVKGNVHVSSKVCASAFYGDGTNITGIPITGNISVANAIVGGTLRVSGATSLEDAVVMKSTVTVIGAAHLQGATSLGSTLKVLGATTITGNTGFLGTVRVSGATSIEGAAVLKSTLTVVGATHLQSTLSVAGNGTFAEKVCASAFFGDGSNLTNVAAVITGNISVNNATIGGNLFVGGTATIVGNTTMTANLGVGGTLDVVSNASIGGTAKITGTTTITGNSGFLGTVRVSGATSLGSTLAVAGNTSLGGTVTITGNVMVSSGLIAVKNGGSQSEVRLYCESGNAHYAALQAPAHSAFSGNITLTLPAVTDTIAGIAATQVFTNKTFGDKVEFDNDVCISGNAFIGGTATIAGNASVGGTLTVGGKAEFDDDVCVSGNTQLVGTLKVTGATTVTGNTGFLGTVRVSGATSLEGTAHITGTTTITGNSGFLGTVRVSGATSLEAGLVVGGKAEFNNDVCVSGNSQLVGTLKVTGATTITGATGVLGSMRVSGATSLEGTLKVLGGAAAAVCATAINGVASVSLNFATAQNWTTTVTAAHTLAKPINCVTGQTGSILLTQSGGSGTMAYNADFKFIGGTDPTMSTANGAVDRLDYIIVSASSDGVGGDIQMIISQAYA